MVNHHQQNKSGFRVHYIIGFLIFGFTLIAYFDRINIGIAAPVLLKDFRWSPAIMGAVMSMFGLGYVLTQIPGGLLADKFGPKKVILFGSLGWALFSFLTPFARSSYVMYLVRGGLGLTEGIYFPSTTSAVGRWMPQRTWGRFQSLSMSGVAAGPLIATPLMAWMIASYGWKSAFYFCAILTAVWALIWLWFYTEKPSEHPMVTPEELAEIESRTTVAAEAAGTTGSSARTLNIWLIGVSYFFNTYAFWMFLNWLPTYLVQGRGFSMIKMGIYGALPWASMLIFMYVGGFLSDFLIKRGIASVLSRRICIYTGLLIMTFGLLLITRATNGYTAVYCITLAMVGFGLTIPSYFSIPLDMGGKEQAGKMTGIINTFSAAAAILAPFITGSLVSVFNWSTALYVVVVAPVIAIVLVFISTVAAKLKSPKADGIA